MKNTIRHKRKEIGMSLSELARRANVSRQTLTKIELHGQNPSGCLMLHIAKGLNATVEEVFTAS